MRRRAESSLPLGVQFVQLSAMNEARSLWLVAIAAFAVYLAAIMPALQRHGFDLSAFIVAGDQGAVLRGYAFVSVVFLVAFSVLIASRVPCAGKPLAAAWLPIVALMSMLSAAGPWVEPIAFLRAFTECWVVGCLLLDADFVRSRFAKPALATLIVIWIGAGWLATTTIN